MDQRSFGAPALNPRLCGAAMTSLTLTKLSIMLGLLGAQKRRASTVFDRTLIPL
jgi:hypothetical protein